MRVRRGALLLVLGLVLSLTPAAAAQIDDPPGPVHPRFLLGGRIGTVRTFSLDAHGRTLRAAEAEGSTSALSVCPGSDVFAELATGVEDGDWWKVAVAVRDVDTFDLQGQHRFMSFERKDGPTSIAPIEIECLDRAGDAVAVYGRRGDTGTIVVVRRGDEDVIFTGTARGVELEGGRGFLAQDAALREVDLRTGRVRHVGTISPGTVSLDVSPDRKHAIFSATGAGDVTKAGHFVLDVAARRVDRLRTRLDGYGWVDDRTFVVFGKDDHVRVFDVGLRKVAQWTGWDEDDGTVRDGVVYVAGHDGVASAPVRTGPAKTLRLFEAPQSFAFEVVQPRRPSPAPAPSLDVDRDRAASPATADPLGAGEPTLPPLAVPDAAAPSSGGASTASAALAVALAVLGGALLVRGRRPAR